MDPATQQATTEAATQSMIYLQLPHRWPEQTDIISLCMHMGPGPAFLLVLLGVVYLLFGFYLYKALITFNATALGALMGLIIGQKFEQPIMGAVLGGFLAAALTWPQMKYAVALMGGLIGGVIGAGIWQSLGLENTYAWTGAMMGLIFFGLLSFILFRGSIMMYTSFQGSMMLVFGLLGLILKYQDIGLPLASKMSVNSFLLPIFVLIPTILGILYQQANAPAPSTGGGSGGSGGGSGGGGQKK